MRESARVSRARAPRLHTPTSSWLRAIPPPCSSFTPMTTPSSPRLISREGGHGRLSRKFRRSRLSVAAVVIHCRCCGIAMRRQHSPVGSVDIFLFTEFEASFKKRLTRTLFPTLRQAWQLGERKIPERLHCRAKTRVSMYG